MIDAYRVVHLNATAAVMVKYFLDDYPAAAKAGGGWPPPSVSAAAQAGRDYRERAGKDRPAGQPRRCLPGDLFRHRQDRGVPDAGLGPLPHGPGPDLPLQHRLLPLLQPAPRIGRVDHRRLEKDHAASSGTTASPMSISPAANRPCATTWPNWSPIAEDLGVITGLLTNGVRLADEAYRAPAQAGRPGLRADHPGIAARRDPQPHGAAATRSP